MDHYDDSISSDDSSCQIDDTLNNIFAPSPATTPTISNQNQVSFADDSYNNIPPSHRRSLEMRYHLEDETKHQLSQYNAQLRKQMDELQLENERLQRQMTVQNKEHRFAKAAWNDKLLDLQVELDATKLEHKRIKEAHEDAQLERELEDLKSQLDDNDQGESSHNDDDGNNEVTKQQSLASAITHTAFATTSENHFHFAIIPPRSSLPNNDPHSEVDAGMAGTNYQAVLMQRTIQELKSEQSVWNQEKRQWESEKSQLYALIQKMTDQVEDSRIRVEWLERELIAICPSDTDSEAEEEKKAEDTKVEEGTLHGEEANHSRGNDSDDDDSSDMSVASTKKMGRSPITETKRQLSRGSRDSSTKASLFGEVPPKRLLEQRLQEALESYVQIQGYQDRKIRKLTNRLNSLEKEKEMDEVMQYQRTAEMTQKISHYQHLLQQTQKTLTLQQHSRDEFHNDWTRRMEELELDNLKLSQQASKWEEQCVHQTGLLKRQLSSLQDKLDQFTRTQNEDELEQQQERQQQDKGEEDSKKSESCTSSSSSNRKVDTMALQLKQSKEREATLEKQLLDQKERLKTKETQLDNARERIKVLMDFVGMDESSGELPSSRKGV